MWLGSRWTRLPVTNGEFLEFVTVGAYADRALLARGGLAVGRISRTNNIRLAGSNKTDCWFYRAMFDQFAPRTSRELAGLREPGRSARLCEVARQTVADGSRVSARRLLRSQTTANRSILGAMASRSRAPWQLRLCRVVAASGRISSRGREPLGRSELVGNGWELTDTPFAPLPGFTPYMTTYPDYSKDFFDGKHFVVKGASWATDAALLRPSFRNWYQAHYPYVFAKFRCVSD